jgi:hypothetical protein
MFECLCLSIASIKMLKRCIWTLFFLWRIHNLKQKSTNVKELSQLNWSLKTYGIHQFSTLFSQFVFRSFFLFRILFAEILFCTVLDSYLNKVLLPPPQPFITKRFDSDGWRPYQRLCSLNLASANPD